MGKFNGPVYTKCRANKECDNEINDIRYSKEQGNDAKAYIARSAVIACRRGSQQLRALIRKCGPRMPLIEKLPELILSFYTAVAKTRIDL